MKVAFPAVVIVIEGCDHQAKKTMPNHIQSEEIFHPIKRSPQDLPSLSKLKPVRKRSENPAHLVNFPNKLNEEFL